MKHPLLILAISAIATFVMGWYGHRVFSNSLETEENKSSREQEIKTDLPVAPIRDTLLTKNQDTVSKEEASIYPVVLKSGLPETNTIDTLWNDSLETITKKPDGSIDIKRKFTPRRKFSDFAVYEKFKGKAPKALDFSTCTSGKLYKSASKAAAASGAVFAGRFAFSIISCGTDCYSSTIVDMKTGKVYAGPHATSGYQFKLNSRLLLVNPPGKEGFYSPCDYCEPELYVWTGKEFKKL